MRSRYFWPGALILVGLLFLLRNLDILRVDVWGLIWPLVLIWLGLGFILRQRGGPIAAVNESQPLEGAASASLTFKHGAGRLNVGAGADSSLLFSGSFGGGVRKRANRVGDRLDVTLEASPQDWAEWMWPANWVGARHGLDWEVSLNPHLPIALTFETGASDNRLDLSGLRVTDLAIKTGASATTLTAPAQGRSRARIESGAASMDVRIPSGVAARIRGVMGMGSLNVDTARFPKRGGEYVSDDFESAENRVELEVQGGVGSVDVK